MIHLGDVSKINGADLEPVELIVFGSPCQDLSVAGKRAGLKHEDMGDKETTRSGLFMEAIRIIKEMRDKTNGEYPTFAFWENVPGAFSSNKGEDFRAVLEEFIKIIEPSAEVPPADKNGWPHADIYLGNGWSLAYRTLNAQHWGVPQRRRRIHLVADFRGERAGEILFKREGLQRNFAESRKAWQNIATDVKGSTRSTNQTSESKVKIPFSKRRRAKSKDDYETWFPGFVSNTLNTFDQGDVRATDIVVETQKEKQPNNESNKHTPIAIDTSHADSVVRIGNISPPLQERDYKGGKLIMDSKPLVMATQQGGAEIMEDKCPTITAMAGMSGNNQPVVCLEGNGSRPSHRGNGWKVDDQMYTLNTIDRHAVCYDASSEENNTASLDNSTVYAMQEYGDYKESDTVSGLKARDYKSATDLICEPTTTYGIDRSGFNQGKNALYDFTISEEQSTTLVARGPNAVCCENKIDDSAKYIVRRLTPLECNRLQGFPDYWGEIDYKENLTDEEYRFWHDVRNTYASINNKQVKDYTKEQMLKWYNKLHTDSAEYKMWGNGIALPTALYVMQGIAIELQKGELNEGS